jgi:hypothetical protein
LLLLNPNLSCFELGQAISAGSAKGVLPSFCLKESEKDVNQPADCGDWPVYGGRNLQEAKENGFKVTMSNFWVAVHNPVYCGKIYIGPYKDEPVRHMPGLHQLIISESLFCDVQDYLDGKKNYRTKLTG